MSYEVCSSESTVVGLRFMTSLSCLQGSHEALFGLRISKLFNEGFSEQLKISLCVSKLPVQEAAHFRAGGCSEQILHLHLVILQTLLSKATYNSGIHKPINLEEANRQRNCP